MQIQPQSQSGSYPQAGAYGHPTSPPAAAYPVQAAQYTYPQQPHSGYQAAQAGQQGPVQAQYKYPQQAARAQHGLVKTSDPSNKSRRFYGSTQSKVSIVFGAVQMLLGFLIMGVGIAHLFVYTYFSNLVYGIWCGIGIMFFSGFILGAGITSTKCMVITSMVMSIIAGAIAQMVFFLALYDLKRSFGSSYYTSDATIVSFALVFLATADGVLAILSACLSCNGLRCCCFLPDETWMADSEASTQPEPVTHVYKAVPSAIPGGQPLNNLAGGSQSIDDGQHQPYNVKM